ncbi:membrane protein, CHP00698 family [Sulfurimonas gotlandica GD1]|uniref:Membrane protein, CHP00698 family n=1 Tax=Sulfurimonas gotlandica (strain DSM 19862 / JCM 16533 / GD1) TaxID=929558 RepID=B6BGS3_SULGG|nr:YeiH family protein [Sulfurimonas gotlandica]EDZ63200.1 membrane protein [Sulfurimonas gotlandica GD1]EHP29705.1 membrane protein, CHP00698 family [Sulfurimonas gotlandica GD1]
MAFSEQNRKGTISGIIFVAIFAAAATMIADISAVKSLGISPLVIGIVMGIFYANTLHNNVPSEWSTGITFSGKKILRFAIVFYGFRITFQQIADVGMSGFMVSLIMLSTTFILGSYLGYKIFKMEKDTAMLTASGAAVCGAAAVLATEPVLKAEGHKTAIAVSMVVLFGTISMFLYPVLYASIIEPATGFLHMTPQEFGIYVGGTIHEVAQVVAVPASVVGAPAEMANSAVIVKMTRVIMIAPMLIALGIYLSMQAKKSGDSTGPVKLVIPWFAVYFIGMAGFNSLQLVPQNIVDVINEIDTFLLTMAMTALGMGTIFSKFKGLGLAPLYTAGAMFVWLVIGGFVITKVVTAIF